MNPLFRKLKSKTVKMLGPAGGYRIARTLTSTTPRILMYHRFSEHEEQHKVSSRVFEQQLLELKKNYNVVSLPELTRCLRSGERLPQHTISITVDDGYQDFYKVAFPLLDKYEIPATVFVTSDFVDRNIWLWPDELNFILGEMKQDHLSFSGLPGAPAFDIPAARDKLWARLVEHCIALPDSQRRKFIAAFAERAGIDTSQGSSEQYAPMNWEQVREMCNRGITIGAHTRTHPILSTVPDSELVDEISGSKAIIENAIQKEVTNFCYPNGQKSDYSEQAKQVVIDSGFSDACAAFHDGSPNTDLFELRRHAIDHNMFQFFKSISGVELIGRRLANQYA